MEGVSLHGLSFSIQISTGLIAILPLVYFQAIGC